MHSVALATTLLFSLAAAKTVKIDVGKGGLTFSPDSSTADVGDTLEFHFFGTFHTAVQGDFDTPCKMGSLSGTGFNSGSIKNGADGSGSVFQVQVKDTKPIWFYCGTPSHCQSGMVGAINAPSSGNTLAAYKAAAAGTDSSELGPSVVGGVVVPVGTSPSGGESSSSSSAEASSTSAASSAASSAESSAAESTSAAETTAAASTSAAGSTSAAVITSAAAPTTQASNPGTNATVTGQPSQTFVPASEGSKLMELAGNTVLFGVVAAFGILAAFA